MSIGLPEMSDDDFDDDGYVTDECTREPNRRGTGPDRRV
jgi:hypothetical protein